MSSRQFAEHQARQRFSATMKTLHEEMARTAPPTERRHLETLIELLEAYLPPCGDSLITAAYRQALSDIRLRVATRHNLRLIRGSQHP